MPKIKKVSDALSLLKHLPRRGTMFYRGEGKQHSLIVPSVYRESGWIRHEDELFREFVLRNPDEFESENSTFEVLAKMQHYSLPTRLLDLTANPLIALYFACEDENCKKDGYLIALDIPDKYLKFYDSDTVSVISNIARRPVGKLNVRKLPKKKRKFNKTPEVQYLIHEIKHEKPYFKDLVDPRHIESAVCVKPKLKNRRLIKQEGAFLLFGINGKKKACANIPNKIKVTRLRIPGHKKGVIKKHLEVLGLSRDKIYPEMDEVANYLREKFK